MSEKVYQPIEPPTTPCVSDPRADLKDVERAMYDEVLEHFSRDNYTIPGVDDGALMEREKFFVSYECILRWVSVSKRTRAQHIFALP
jgi:CRAL/TRIO, N-terminal domain